MAGEDDDNKRVQQEHGSYFSGTSNEEETPEQRYEPVEVDLGQPEPKQGEAAPDRGAEQLRAQLNQAREQTALAQRQAQELAQRAQFAEQRAIGSTVGMIDSALEAAQHQAVNAKAKFQAALDAADHATAAQAQEEMADARHNLLRLQEQRAIVEQQARQPQPQQPQRQHPAQNAPPPVEAIMRDLAQTGYPRSADWLRSHPEWTSPDRMKRVASAHNHLVDNRGLVAETDEYFSALEQELGMGQQQRGAAPNYGNGRRPSQAAAPASTAQPSLRTGQTVRRGHVQLNPAQREAAELSGMTDREYAESFEDARTSGKLIGYR
jgi:hypothetical protein